MTSYQYQRAFTGKRLRNPHLNQYPCFDVRAEHAAEPFRSPMMNNTTYRKQISKSQHFNEPTGFLGKIVQKVRGLFTSYQDAALNESIGENDFRNLQIDPPFASKTNFRQLVTGVERNPTHLEEKMLSRNGNACYYPIDSREETKFSENQIFQAPNTKENRKMMLARLQEERIAQRMRQSSRDFKPETKEAELIDTEVPKIERISHLRTKIVRFVSDSEDSVNQSLSETAFDGNRANQNQGCRPRKRVYCPRDISDENRISRLKELETVFTNNAIQLEEEREAESLPEPKTKKIKVTKLKRSKKAEERVQIGRFNIKKASKEPNSNKSGANEVSMIPEEQILVQEQEMPAGKEFNEKKDDHLFDEQSIDSGDTQSCSGLIEKETQGESYYNTMEEVAENRFSSAASTQLTTPAKELQQFSTPTMISKAQAEKPLLTTIFETNEDNTIGKVIPEATEKKENIISSVLVQSNQTSTNGVSNKEDKSDKLHANPEVVEESASKSLVQQQQQPAESSMSDLVLKNSLEKTSDFLKDLQSNPFLTSSSSVMIVDNPFVSSNNTSASQNIASVPKFSLDTIISQNMPANSSLLGSIQTPSSNTLFSNIGMNTQSNSSSVLDNLIRNNSSTQPSISNTSMDVIGNFNSQMSTNLPWNNFTNTQPQSNTNTLLGGLLTNSGGSQSQGNLGAGIWNNSSSTNLNNLFGNQTATQNNWFSSTLQGNLLPQVSNQSQGSLYQGGMSNGFSTSNWSNTQSSMTQYSTGSQGADLFGGSNANSATNNAFLQGTANRPYRVLKGVRGSTRMNDLL